MSFISKRFGQFTYFDLQFDKPIWKGKRVLDFGGNIGNMLKDPNSSIDHDKYWCIDVSRDAIEEGKKTYSKAHWVFYDRYNFAFNPTGIEGLAPPDVGQEFDYIVAYSVFTHTSKSEMMELTAQLESQLAPDGILGFTFIDPHFNPAMSNGTILTGYYNGAALKQRLERLKEDNPAIDIDSLLAKARDARWCILANDDDLYVENENIRHYEEGGKKSFCAFYTSEYMRTIFPHAGIMAPKHCAYPANGRAVLQHCCVIKRGAGDD